MAREWCWVEVEGAGGGAVVLAAGLGAHHTCRLVVAVTGRGGVLERGPVAARGRRWSRECVGLRATMASRLIVRSPLAQVLASLDSLALRRSVVHAHILVTNLIPAVAALASLVTWSAIVWTDRSTLVVHGVDVDVNNLERAMRVAMWWSVGEGSWVSKAAVATVTTSIAVEGVVATFSSFDAVHDAAWMF